MGRAVVVHELKQFISGQILTPANEAGQAAVAHVHGMANAALAAEMEAHGGAVDLDVAVAQGGQAERAVGSRILLIADADERRFEQTDDGGEDLARGSPGRARSVSMRARTAGSVDPKAIIR